MLNIFLSVRGMKSFQVLAGWGDVISPKIDTSIMFEGWGIRLDLKYSANIIIADGGNESCDPAPLHAPPLHVYVPMFHSVKIILFLSSKMIYNIIISLNELLYLFVWRGLRSVVLQPWHCPVSDITMGPRWHWPLPRSPAALWGLPQSDSDPEEANMKEDRTIMSITCYLLTWNVQIRILLRVLSVFKKINPSEPRLGPHLCTVYRQRPAISGWEGPHGRGGRR